MILSIAGSDPSGGAGIQADLKTFAALGVYGGAAITALTVQNTGGVRSFSPVAPELVRQQIAAVLEDLPVSHVKTGMMGSLAVAAAVADALGDFSGEVVCDPVLKSSDGHDLLGHGSADLHLSALVGHATMLTPNLLELRRLTGSPCRDDDEITAAATWLLERFPRLKGVAITGGHRQEQAETVTDLCIYRQGPGWAVQRATHPRINSRNTHGTGCTFASALAAYHLLTGDYRQAFDLAVNFVSQLLAASAGARLGRGTGPLLHHLFQAIPEERR